MDREVPPQARGEPRRRAYGQRYLPELADVMNGVVGYFTGCDGYLNNR